MKILWISLHAPSFPSSGAALRMYYLTREVARRHEVHYVMLGDKDSDSPSSEFLAPWLTSFRRIIVDFPRKAIWPRPFRRLGGLLTEIVGELPDKAWMENFREPLLGYLCQNFSTKPPDIVHLDSVFTMHAILGLSLGEARWHLDLCDLLHRQYWRLGWLQSSPRHKLRFWWAALRAYFWEVATIRSAHSLSAVNLIEAKWLKQKHPEVQTYLVPNGIDIEHFRPSFQLGEPEELVFVGKMDYLPNHEAAMFLARSVLPEIRRTRPQARLRFVGMNPMKDLQALNGQNGIEVTGRVADTRPYLRKARVVLTTVRGGTGTRLKILEAMAMGKPIVSTSLGAEGLDVTPGVHLLIANSSFQIAEAVLRILEDDGLAIRLGRAARDLASSTYDWKDVVEGLTSAYVSEKPFRRS